MKFEPRQFYCGHMLLTKMYMTNHGNIHHDFFFLILLAQGGKGKVSERYHDLILHHFLMFVVGIVDFKNNCRKSSGYM